MSVGTTNPVVTIFGSARPLPGSPGYELAYHLGKALASRGFAVCNGGYAGTMEAAAKGAREAGGHTIGVTCDLFTRIVNPWIVEEVRTPRLTERIIKLADLGSAFVILPGGTGTLLELAFVLEMVNKRFSIEKPVILQGPFWQPVLRPLEEEMRQEGLEDVARFLSTSTSPQKTADLLHERVRPPWRHR
ncbi:MAG: LOG family protein [Bacteroidetes bacterium]|nr:LOG family protein [Bacteroidota bacterium]